MLPSFDPYRTGSFPVPRAAALAEQAGFDAVWVGDHLAYHPPTMDALCALASAAAVTERVTLGTAVLLLALRHPAWTAKQLASLDALAPGRVVLGVGVGGEGEAEFRAAGVPLAGRGRRLDESLEVLYALLRGDAVDHRGPSISLTSPRLEPVPSLPPPLVVGGRSVPALDRAARVADGWMAVWVTPDRLSSMRAELARKAENLGRPCPRVLLLVFCCLTDDPDRGWNEAAELLQGQYRLPIEKLARWIHVGSAEKLASDLSDYRNAGADGFVILPVARDGLAQIEALGPLRPAGRYDGATDRPSAPTRRD